MRASNNKLLLLLSVLSLTLVAHSAFADSPQGRHYRIISGVASSDNKKPIKVNLSVVFRELESELTVTGEAFRFSDVLGYAEKNGKFWIVVSAANPPLAHSPAHNLYTYLIGYRKNQTTFHDVTIAEFHFMDSHMNLRANERPHEKEPTKPHSDPSSKIKN